MTKKTRPTQLDREKFHSWVAEHSGATVCLDYDIWPSWAKKARDPKVDTILFFPHKGPQTGKTFDFDTADGRITVLRYDAKDASKGGPYNKDTYVVVCGSDGTPWQFGPYSKGEPRHWLASIREDYEGWPVVYATKKKGKK